MTQKDLYDVICDDTQSQKYKNEVDMTEAMASIFYVSDRIISFILLNV